MDVTATKSGSHPVIEHEKILKNDFLLCNGRKKLTVTRNKSKLKIANLYKRKKPLSSSD